MLTSAPIGERVPLVGGAVALVGELVALVGGAIALVGGPVTLVGELVTLVGGAVALVCEQLTLVSFLIAPVGRLLPLVRSGVVLTERFPERAGLGACERSGIAAAGCASSLSGASRAGAHLIRAE